MDFQIRFFSCGTAPRLSERRTYTFGLSNWRTRKMKKEYFTDFSLSYRSLIPSPVFLSSAEIFSTYLHQSRADFPVILAAQLLLVFFVLREECAFLFQTFSRSDPQKKISQKSPTSFREWIMNFRFISIFCDEFCIFLRIITI